MGFEETEKWGYLELLLLNNAWTAAHFRNGIDRYNTFVWPSAAFLFRIMYPCRLFGISFLLESDFFRLMSYNKTLMLLTQNWRRNKVKVLHVMSADWMRYFLNFCFGRMYLIMRYATDIYRTCKIIHSMFAIQKNWCSFLFTSLPIIQSYTYIT